MSSSSGTDRFKPASRSRLTPRDLRRFTEHTLFHRVARVVCEASCLPRKELYESWEVARRARRRFRGGRVVDMPSGHALIGSLMLLLDARLTDVLAVDRAMPKSAYTLRAAMASAWPQLAGRVQLLQGDIADVSLRSTDLVVSAHACGGLTDAVLRLSVMANARVVVLPCCHSFGRNDTGNLEGWMDGALAIDVTRAASLRAQGYRVHTQCIPDSITPKNRLLFGEPPS